MPKLSAILRSVMREWREPVCVLGLWSVVLALGTPHSIRRCVEDRGSALRALIQEKEVS